MKLIASVINLCFNLVLMFICFEKYSSVINLNLFWKHLISYTGAQQNLWIMLPTLVQKETISNQATKKK